MDYTTLILGLFFFIIGIALRYWINRRKFNRRNASGLEGFTNYERATATRFLEGLIKLIAYAAIIIGLLFLLTYWMEKRQLEKKAQKNIEVQKLSK